MLSDKKYSAVKFIDDILLTAIEKNASDIHFEPYEQYCRVRLRIDGLLHEIIKTELSFSQQFGARLKIMSGLDISERRLPQDGRFSFQISTNKNIACRISTCPASFGEKIVIRILNPENVIFRIEELGLTEEQQQIFLHFINRPEGLILVTGPTSSGKTVSLYTALNILNSEHKNISTVEDPIEINLNGVNQTAINNKIGLDFATVLRAFLRQDPDVIMVGEIRDLDTAEIAIRAAQTGHLVLATLHANSAAEALSRLLNMGIAAFNLASSITLIIAQRLSRKLCPFCKKKHHFQETILQELGLQAEETDTTTIFKACGCEQCYKGYKGRIGIFEFMPFTSQQKALLLSRGNAFDIGSANSKGQSLRKMGLDKMLQGITSLEEINRIIF